jgi:quinol monooxygenase YgiN
MSYITCIYHLSVEPSHLGAFKELVAEIVAVSTLEPKTLVYEYSASSDEREIHIIERYLTDGVLPHVEKTFAPYAQKFLEMAKIERVYVHGRVPPDVKHKLESFGAIFMSPISGFSKPLSSA